MRPRHVILPFVVITILAFVAAFRFPDRFWAAILFLMVAMSLSAIVKLWRGRRFGWRYSHERQNLLWSLYNFVCGIVMAIWVLTFRPFH